MHTHTTDRHKVAALRVEAGLSQVQLAELSGVASTTISRIESGATNGHPTNIHNIAVALSEKLGRTVSVTDLHVTNEAAS